MNLKTRLARLEKMDFKFCPLCGTDWQPQQQLNRRNQTMAKNALQSWSEEDDVNQKCPEFLASVKRMRPDILFFAIYREQAPLGWNKEAIPPGFCLCGRDLVPEETREEEQFARLVETLQSQNGLDEATATREAQIIMEMARALEMERDGSL